MAYHGEGRSYCNPLIFLSCLSMAGHSVFSFRRAELLWLPSWDAYGTSLWFSITAATEAWAATIWDWAASLACALNWPEGHMDDQKSVSLECFTSHACLMTRRRWQYYQDVWPDQARRGQWHWSTAAQEGTAIVVGCKSGMPGGSVGFLRCRTPDAARHELLWAPAEGETSLQSQRKRELWEGMCCWCTAAACRTQAGTNQLDGKGTDCSWLVRQSSWAGLRGHGHWVWCELEHGILPESGASVGSGG